MYYLTNLFSLVDYGSINNRSVIYPSLTAWGPSLSKGIIITCITYDPPVLNMPVGSSNKVCPPISSKKC